MEKCKHYYEVYPFCLACKIESLESSLEKEKKAHEEYFQKWTDELLESQRLESSLAEKDRETTHLFDCLCSWIDALNEMAIESHEKDLKIAEQSREISRLTGKFEGSFICTHIGGKCVICEGQAQKIMGQSKEIAYLKKEVNFQAFMEAQKEIERLKAELKKVDDFFNEHRGGMSLCSYAEGVMFRGVKDALKVNP